MERAPEAVRRRQLSVHRAGAVGIDDTSWREDRRKVHLWAVVTGLATDFTIAARRSGAVARALLGSEPGRVVGSDRHGAFEWIDPAWRQVCWSHLMRDFQAMIDRRESWGADRSGVAGLGQADVPLVAQGP